MRMCTGCGEMKPKRELVRVVKAPERPEPGKEAAAPPEISLDPTGKKPGRGAYLCPDPACLTRAKKSRAIERALSAPTPPEVWDALEAQMKAGDGGD